MSITNSNFNARSILGLHRDKVFTSSDTLSNSQLTVPFLQQNLGNVVTNNDSSFNYNPYTKTLSVPNITGVVSQNEVSPVVDDIAYHLIGTADDPSAGTIDTTLNADVNLSYTRKSSGENQLTIRSDDSQLCLFKTPTHPNDHGYKLRYNSSPSEFTIVQTTGGVDEVIMTISASGDVSFANDLTIGGVFSGDGSLLTSVSSETSDITDTGDDTDYYLVFTDSSGSGKTLRVNETSSPGDTFTYNPSTNKLSVLRVYCGYIEADNYIGVKTSELTGLIENLQLRNSYITIGTTTINLGNTVTELFGLTKLHIGNSANAVQLTIDGATAYPSAGFLIGGWSGGNDANKHTIQSSSNLHIDSADNGDIYMNFYSARGINLCVGGGNVGIGDTFAQSKLSVINRSATGGYTYANVSAGFFSGAATGGVHGPQLGGDYISGNSFIQSGFNRTGYGYNLILQPSSGNVGIGNSSPSAKLHISNTSTCITFIESTSNAAYMNTKNVSSGGLSYFGTDGNGLMNIDAGATIVGSSAGKNIYISPGLSAKMTITSAGNVGIGIGITPNPSHKLDVDGNVFSNNGFYTPTYTSGGNYYFGTEYLSRILAGMEIEHTTPGNFSQKLHFRTHHFGVSEDRRMTIDEDGNVGIGYLDPQNKLEVLGDIKCGNSANTLTALDIEINSSFAYGILIGGWSSGGLTAGNSTIEMSSNLHIDSPSSGSIGPGNIYLNYYNAAQSTYIRNREDISDKRIKKDIVEIETEEQFNETFEIIKKVGSYKYKYRDIYRENDLDQYGFIAQEVLENYPVACKLAGNNCYLPNIMETLNFTYEVGEENQYTFTITGYELDVDVKYLFYGFREGVEQFDYLENVEPTSGKTFAFTPTVVKNQGPPTYIKLVLVGTYTDDKLGVSKDKLFQLGFAGVRGLIAENESLKEQLGSVEARLAAVEARLASL